MPQRRRPSARLLTPIGWAFALAIGGLVGVASVLWITGIAPR